jgi:hypothetical protein
MRFSPVVRAFGHNCVWRLLQLAGMMTQIYRLRPQARLNFCIAHH